MDATKELLGPFVVVDVRREPLRAMTDDMAYGWDEVRREGFPGMTPAGFVKMFCGSHVGCTPDTIITRIDSGTSPFS